MEERLLEKIADRERENQELKAENELLKQELEVTQSVIDTMILEV